MTTQLPDWFTTDVQAKVIEAVNVAALARDWGYKEIKTALVQYAWERPECPSYEPDTYGDVAQREYEGEMLERWAKEEAGTIWNAMP